MKAWMRLPAVFCLLTFSCVGMTFCQTPAASDGVWFHERVTWQIGGELRFWDVTSPDGKLHYRLALVPWHGTEGGGFIEIRVARPDHPKRNLLDPGKWRRAPAYYVTGEDLEHPDQSQYGATRVFAVGRGKLRVVILGSRLGHGYGLCPGCPYIQELTLDLTMGTKATGHSLDTGRPD